MQLSIRLNCVDQATISRWESGEQIPSLIAAIRLARVFGVKVEEIAKGIEW